MIIATPEFSEKMTAAEYLQWEEQQEFRYEYIDGAVIAMTKRTLPYMAKSTRESKSVLFSPASNRKLSS